MSHEKMELKVLIGVEQLFKERVSHGQTLSTLEFNKFYHTHHDALVSAQEKELSPETLAPHVAFSQQLLSVIDHRRVIESEIRRLTQSIEGYTTNMGDFYSRNQQQGLSLGGLISSSGVSAKDLRQLTKLSEHLRDQLVQFNNGVCDERVLVSNCVESMNHYINKMNSFSKNGLCSLIKTTALSFLEVQSNHVLVKLETLPTTLHNLVSTPPDSVKATQTYRASMRELDPSSSGEEQENKNRNSHK